MNKMPDLYLVLDLVVVVALIGLGITVLIKNLSVELNRIFALFVCFVSVWIMANYVSNDTGHAPQTATYADYLVFFFSYAAAAYLLRFAVILADDKRASKVLSYLSWPLLIVGLLAATPLVVKGVHVQGQLYAVEFGPAAALYFVSLVAMVVASVYIIYRNIRISHGDQRARLKVLFTSLLWTFPFLLLANAILPALTGWFGLTNVGITPMLILVFGLYYGVVKHRLFDLRLIVVRSLVYGATLGVVSVFYALATHYVANALASNGDGHGVTRDAINIGLIVIVVLAYEPLKRGFNRVTNKFFYRDAYDPQTFFNIFNQSLVANVELNHLLQGATSLISDTLKTEYCVVGLAGSEHTKPRLIGTADLAIAHAEVSRGLHLLNKVQGTVVVTDGLVNTNEPLKQLLDKNNIAVLTRLSSGGNQHEFGYMLIGAKKSGNPYNHQDLKVLEAATNELAIAVQNAFRFEEIEAFNVTLQEKIEEATKRLRQTNTKLRMLDETKDDFISMASHQLRTPLTSVKGYVSMVLDGDAGKITPLQRKLLNQAFISSQRMVYLISDLLNVSRLRTGKFVIEPTATNLAKVIQDEIEQLVETAKSRNLELVYNKPEHFPTYMLDETKLRQVVMNFIDNAIYYTPSGGRIEVNLVEKAQSIEYTVVDNGIGVPKSEQHHLFSKFFRANNAKRARPDGTGLGLFMAKKVVIAQGGAVIFRSTEGKGSTFGFSFAKDKLATPPTPVK